MSPPRPAELIQQALAAIPTVDKPGASLDTFQGELALAVTRLLVETAALDKASTTLTAGAHHCTTPTLRRAMAEQWLLIARAWARHTTRPDGSANAEAALREALALEPSIASPALAQHLAGQKRWSEAIASWQTAVQTDPQQLPHYLGLARAYEEAGEPELALATYLELVQTVQSSNRYLIAAECIDRLASSLPQARPEQTIRVALLGNATLDHLRSYVKIECYRAGLQPVIYQSGFDQYSQEILDPTSGLYAFKPDVVVLAIHASRLFPRLHDYPFDLAADERLDDVDEGLATVRGLLSAFTAHSSAMMLLHNMVSPQHPSLGIADWRDELGQSALFGRINESLANLVRTDFPSVYIVDEERAQARCGKSRATDARLWYTARLGWSDPVLSELAGEYLRYIRPYKGLHSKCVVVDLDNTLWGGVIGEDGLDGIQLGPDAPGNAYLALQHELEKLWRRGVLLAICSKNNPEDVANALEHHPAMVLRPEHFAAQRVNWESKGKNLREIAAELNLGLDSLVFLDDSPVERAVVRSECPEVRVVELPHDPAGYRQALLGLKLFDSLVVTDEDRARGKMYASQRQRREAASALGTGGSLEEYLVSLQIEVEIASAHESTLPRIAQLTTKTNQCTLTTRRYTAAQIEELQERGWLVLSMRVVDKFGDNGLTGVAMIAPQGDGCWELDNLLLSCRVMGRGVETALLAAAIDLLRERGATRLKGWYLPTAKNAPARDFYGQHSFTLLDTTSTDGELWELDLASAHLASPGWLTVQVAAVPPQCPVGAR